MLAKVLPDSNKKNYLIVGTGGVGGSIAGFLALGGKQVACIARGAQLEAIRQHGLHLKSDLKGEHWLKVPACTAEAYEGKADVIFVCVKGYALDSIQDLLRRVATPDTLVVPILNVYGTGERLARLVPEVTVLDGCIYIVGFISGPGEITQSGSVFRLVYGARSSQPVARERLDALAEELRGCGIKVDVSEDINRDTFVKWSFISAMACTGAYFDVPMGEVQHAGEVRDVLRKRVRDVVTSPVVAATPLTDIRRIARVMLEHNVDGVPIVNDNGGLQGFISRSDILNAIVTDPPLSMWL